MNCRMLSITAALLASVPSVALAVTYNVSTVAELENAVWNAAAKDVIKLASGIYDLSTTQHQGTPGHLYTANQITLEGATTNPEDTVLRGSGNRILYLAGQRNVIRNLTFENGDVTTYQQTTTPADYPRGGAICFTRSNAGTVSNCIFRNNRASLGGGAIASHSVKVTTAAFTDCVFSNNVATVADAKGGAIYLAGVLSGCHFEKNSLSGTTSTMGGALYNAEKIENCTFKDNSAVTGAGAVYFVTNAATATPVVTGCTFTGNRSAGKGSAISSDGTYGELLLVTNCTFRENAPLQEGGALNGTVANLDNVVDCKFLSNTANNGGAAHTCTLKGCLLEGNTATDVGGAAYASTLVACTNRANATAASKIRASELAGVSSAADCVFENVGNSAKVLFDTGTTLERCRISAVDGYLFTGTFTVKNCLIADSSNCYLFYKSESAATMCNVTVANNVFKAFKTSHACETMMVIENSFFYGNKLGNANYDIDQNALGAVSAFNHCILSAPATVEVPGEDNLNYYGTAFNPRFVGAEESPADPYALLPGSPAARRVGAVKDWMASTTDIRGEGYPRLRDGKVNIGCYQCWLNPNGMVLFLR